MAESFFFDGANDTLKELEKLQTEAPDAFANALFQEAQIELKEIKIVTPVKTGALRGSEELIGPFRKGKRIFVIVQAGGPTATYAFEVHEDLEAFHPRGGQAKYIEGPLRESLSSLGNRIAARINRQRTFFVGRLAPV